MRNSMAQIAEEPSRFVGEAEQSDDITMVLLRRL